MARHRFGGDTASWATNLGDDATTPSGADAKVGGATLVLVAD